MTPRPRPPGSPAVEELDRAACLELLSQGTLGRLAVSMPDDPPLVLPVNYMMDGDVVIFRTDDGTKLDRLRSAAVTFEVDGEDPSSGLLWSVLLHGLACESRLVDLRYVPLERLRSAAPGDKRHWIRIVPWAISGRRFAPVAVSGGTTMRQDPRRQAPIAERLASCAAAVFDLDGVVTDTAVVHAAAWKEVFDELLAELLPTDAPGRLFDASDYRRHVDGKSRADGVRDFLAARGLDPTADTIEDIGRRKDACFQRLLQEGGVRAFPDAVRLISALRSTGRRVGVASASRNARAVLAATGLTGAFDVCVDGVEASRLGLPGKPDPALFLEAAARLASPPGETALFEDALAGVEAGRRGGFGLVIGVVRQGTGATLTEVGADIVVHDLRALIDIPGGATAPGGAEC